MSLPKDSREQARTADILVVEDDDIDARGITRAFRKAGFKGRVHRAVDGIDALEQLRCADTDPEQKVPRFLLVDLNMPRMGGLELIEQVRNDPELSSKIVFVLTTSDLPTDINAAYQLNVAGYIVKAKTGEDHEDLIALLRKYTEVVELP